MIKKDTHTFIKEVESLYGNEYTVIGDYIKSCKKILIRHNACNNEFLVTPNNLIKGHGCSICAGNSKHTIETLEYKLKLKLYDDSYKIISISKYGKVKVFHSKCGNIYETSKNSIIAGSGCSKCSASKGEIEIRRILNFMNIEFIEQYKFEKCMNIRSLPFDFYIPKLNTCIEYDGEGHYKPFKYKNALDKLKKTKINDSIKEEFCKNNSIKLIRIPYYDFDIIEDILKATL